MKSKKIVALLAMSALALGSACSSSVMLVRRRLPALRQMEPWT